MNFRKDIILLLLYVPGVSGTIGEPIKGRTRLMKGIFLFNQELAKRFRRGLVPAEGEVYEFFPWSFGPFSRDVYSDLDFLIGMAYVQAEMVESQGASEETVSELEEWEQQTAIELQPDSPGITEYSEEQFSLKELGKRFVEDVLLREVTAAQLSLLSEFKRRLCGTPLRAIIKYVYQSYPDYARKSEIARSVR